MTSLENLFFRLQTSPFWQQPIDQIAFTFLLWFGWIPIAIVLIWGFTQLWLAYRQGQYASSRKYILLAIDVPAETEQTPKAIENLFANLYGARTWPTLKEKWLEGKFNPIFSFEIISNEGYIQFLIRTEPKYRDVIESGIYAQYPEAEIAQVEDYTTFAPDAFPDDDYNIWGSEITLRNDWIFPIRTHVDFEDRSMRDYQDPLGPVLEQMAKMRPGEHFWFQILLQPASSEWRERGLEFIDEEYGRKKEQSRGLIAQSLGGLLALPSALLEEAFDIRLSGATEEDADKDPFYEFRLTPTQKERMEAVLQKTTKPGYSAKIRMVYLAKQAVFQKGARATMIKGLLNQYTHLNLNGFGLYGPTVPKDDYFWQEWSKTARQEELVQAYKNRSFSIGATPYILNAEELATIWHFPSISVNTPLIRRALARRAEPPTGLPSTLGPGNLPTEGPDSGAPAGLPGIAAGDTGEQTPEPLGDASPELPTPTSPTADIPGVHTETGAPENLPAIQSTREPATETEQRNEGVTSTPSDSRSREPEQQTREQRTKPPKRSSGIPPNLPT